MKEVARNLEPAKTIPCPVNIQKWAIIVGISKYKDESLNLKYADRDIEELYKLLLTSVGVVSKRITLRSSLMKKLPLQKLQKLCEALYRIKGRELYES